MFDAHHPCFTPVTLASSRASIPSTPSTQTHQPHPSPPINVSANTTSSSTLRKREKSPSVHTEDEGYSTEEGMITPKKAKAKDLPVTSTTTATRVNSTAQSRVLPNQQSSSRSIGSVHSIGPDLKAIDTVVPCYEPVKTPLTNNTAEPEPGAEPEVGEIKEEEEVRPTGSRLSSLIPIPERERFQGNRDVDMVDVGAGRALSPEPGAVPEEGEALDDERLPLVVPVPTALSRSGSPTRMEGSYGRHRSPEALSLPAQDRWAGSGEDARMTRVASAEDREIEREPARGYPPRSPVNDGGARRYAAGYSSRYDERDHDRDRSRGGYRGSNRGRGAGAFVGRGRYSEENRRRSRSRSRDRERDRSRSRSPPVVMLRQRSRSISRSRSRSPRPIGLAARRSRSPAPLPVQRPVAPFPRAPAQPSPASVNSQPILVQPSRISRSRSRSRSSRSSDSRSRSNSSTRSRKIPTAPKGPRNFNPPTGPSNRGTSTFTPRGIGYRGGRGGAPYHPHSGFAGRGGYGGQVAGNWAPRFPAGGIPSGPAKDRLGTGVPLGPSSDREREQRERDREQREREREREQEAEQERERQKVIEVERQQREAERERESEREMEERDKSSREPVVGRWAARKAKDAAERTPETPRQGGDRGLPLRSSPIRSTSDAVRRNHQPERERSGIPGDRAGEGFPGQSRPDTGTLSGSVKRENIPLPPAQPAERPRQEVRISFSQATTQQPIGRSFSDTERRPTGLSVSTARSMSSMSSPQNPESDPVNKKSVQQQVLSPLGSSVPSRPITPVVQVKQDSAQGSRPSSSHAPSAHQPMSSSDRAQHALQQQQQQQQAMQLQRSRSHRHVDRSWRGYPAPEKLVARPRQAVETVIKVTDPDRMDVEGEVEAGGVIRIRARESIPGVDLMDAQVSLIRVASMFGSGLTFMPHGVQLADLRHERDKKHHAFQAQAATLRWNRFDVTLAEQELEAARRKTAAAGMTYINPESFGMMSPLRAPEKELEAATSGGG